MRGAGTYTASSAILYALCACCTTHGGSERPLERRIVTCPECGGPCSCEGCVVEVDEGYRK